MAGMVLTSGLAAYALIQRAAAQRQTVRAEAEARTAQETTRFLIDLFKISDPSEARGNTVTAREMLDKGAAKIEHELAERAGHPGDDSWIPWAPCTWGWVFSSRRGR